MSRSQDKSDESIDDTRSPEIFWCKLKIASRSSTNREFDDAANDTEVRNFEIQAGDHKQGVRRGSRMTTKVTNKVQSFKSEITSRTARDIDKDRGQGCPEF